MRWGFAIALTVACASPQPQTQPQPQRPLTIAPIERDTDHASTTASDPIARGEVIVSFFLADGSYWPGLVSPNPPGDIVKPCIDGPGAIRPLTTGFLVFSIELPFNAPAALKLVDGSPKLPPALTACVARTLSGLRRTELSFNPTGLIAYVSLR